MVNDLHSIAIQNFANEGLLFHCFQYLSGILTCLYTFLENKNENHTQNKLILRNQEKSMSYASLFP